MSVRGRDLEQTTAPDEFRNIGKDSGDVFVASVDIVTLREHPESIMEIDKRNLRHWSTILVPSENVTDRTKSVLKELLTPLERRDHHVGRVLHV